MKTRTIGVCCAFAVLFGCKPPKKNGSASSVSVEEARVLSQKTRHFLVSYSRAIVANNSRELELSFRVRAVDENDYLLFSGPMNGLPYRFKSKDGGMSGGGEFMRDGNAGLNQESLSPVGEEGEIVLLAIIEIEIGTLNDWEGGELIVNVPLEGFVISESDRVPIKDSFTARIQISHEAERPNSKSDRGQE